MRISLIILCAFLCPMLLAAHPGGLDASGGHWDRATGTYHYHKAAAPKQADTAPLRQPLETFEGKVVGISDGDTISVLREGKSVRIRLDGIDAPESSQAFGQRAKQYVSDACFNALVRVLVYDTDRYGRLVAEIVLPSGAVLNRLIVAAGFAWHYKDYSDDAELARLELGARNARIGLWSDPTPLPPWEYRRR